MARLAWLHADLLQSANDEIIKAERESWEPEPELIPNIQVYHYHNDHLGTPNELTNQDGEVVWLADYEAYGNVAKVVWREEKLGQLKVSSDELQPLRFQGQFIDQETGLHYNRFRYYDPDLGMFISRDPIGLLGGNNVFQYAPNPVGWVDPFGLSCTFDQRSQRWRDRETGRYTTRPSDPSELVHNGRVDYNDLQEWARQANLPNNWKPDTKNFPSGGFKYQDGQYTVHGHGINPNAVQKFPNSNAATGPTVSIKGPQNLNYRTDGTWGKFKTDKNGAHIPLDNSPF